MTFMRTVVTIWEPYFPSHYLFIGYIHLFILQKSSKKSKIIPKSKSSDFVEVDLIKIKSMKKITNKTVKKMVKKPMVHESGVELTLETDPLKVQELALFAQWYKVNLTKNIYVIFFEFETILSRNKWKYCRKWYVPWKWCWINIKNWSIKSPGIVIVCPRK